MRTRTLILSLVLIFALPSLNAQVGDLLRNKLNRVVNAGAKAVGKDASDKIDSATLKGAQKVDAATQDNPSQEQSGQADQADQSTGNRQGKQSSGGINLGGLLGGKVTSKFNESYSFKSRIFMQLEMYDKKDVSKVDYYMYFTENEPIAGFESKMMTKSDDGQEISATSSFVFDGINKSFIMMTDMGAMRIGIISEVPEETTQDQQIQKGTLTKTGNTKVIAGYKCDEYIYNDTESKEYSKLWFTRDLKIMADKRTYSKTGLPAYYNNPELRDGTMLAMETYGEKNELKMKSETREVNFNAPHSISTTGYSFRQVNFNQAGQQKK